MSHQAFAFLLNIRKLCDNASKAYYTQYHYCTPDVVLRQYIRKEYYFPEWLKTLHSKQRAFYFICSGERPVGYMRYCKQTRMILKLYIEPVFRNHGAGRKLLRLVLSDSPRVEVYADNKRAIYFYRKMGFTQLADMEYQCLAYRQKGIRMAYTLPEGLEKQ